MKKLVRATLLTGLLALSVSMLQPTSVTAGIINIPGAPAPTCTENCPQSSPSPEPTPTPSSAGTDEDSGSLLGAIYGILSGLPDLF